MAIPINMRTRYLPIMLALFATSALASDDPLAYLKQGQPRDVRELIDRLAGCNHWSGEEPFDTVRRQEIASALKDLQCARLARDEAKARQRHAKNPLTIKAIRQAKVTTW